MAKTCLPRNNVHGNIKRIASVLKKAVVDEMANAKKEGIELDVGEVVATVRAELLSMENKEWLAPLIDEAIEIAWPSDTQNGKWVSYSYSIAMKDMKFKPIELSTFGVSEFVDRVEELNANNEGWEETKEYGQDLVGYGSQKFGDSEMDAFNVNFDMVIGKRISEEDRILKEERAREMVDFDEYLEWVKDYFGLETIYEVSVDMYYDPNNIDETGEPRDVWVVKDLDEAQAQLDAIKAGQGGGINFADRITTYGDHFIISHSKGDHKHIYLKGSEPKSLKKDKKKVKGEPYKKDIKDYQIANLLIYWNTHNNKNSILFDKRNQYVWTNLDQNVPIESMDDLVDAIVDDGKRIVATPNIVLHNQTKQPGVLSKNYIDSLKRTVRNTLMSAMTQYHSVRDSGTLIPKKDGTFWMKPDQNQFSSKDIEKFEYDLSQNTVNGKPAPMVIIGITPGDTGQILTTFVHPQHVQELFDKDEILQTMIDIGFPEKIINEFKEYKRSAASFVMKLIKDQKDFEASRRVKVAGEKSPEITPKTVLRMEQNRLFHNAIYAHGATKLRAYLDNQVKKGNMSSKDADKIYDDALGSMAKSNAGDLVVPYPIHLSGVIARMEWFQALRGDDFMQYGSKTGDITKGANAFNVFDRLKIALTKGVSLSGISDRRTFLIDQERVEYWLDGEKIDHSILTEKLNQIDNIFDGASMSGTESLDLIGEKFGYQKSKGRDHNLREIKTTQYKIDEDGHMFENKHALFAGIAGLEIREIGKKDKPGDLIVRIKEEDGHIRIKDSNGRIVHQIHDMDVTKTATGKYYLGEKQDKNGKTVQSRQTYVEAMVSMDDFKIVISPNPKSSNTTYGVVQYLSNLNFDLREFSPEEQKSFKRYQKAILEMVGGQSDVYIELLLEASTNPTVLWDIIKHSYSDKAEAKHALRSILNITNGAGVYHPNNLSMIKPLILNMLVKRGSMQGRTTDMDLINKISSPKLRNKLKEMASYGSHYVLKPGRAVEKGSVILSADNHVIHDQIVKKIVDTGYWKAWRIATLQATGENTESTFAQLSDEKKAEVMSAFLEEFPQHVLTYRSPIGQAGAVEPRRIQSFVYDEGNAIYHHPDDTFDRLVGDYDIDEAGVVLLNEKQLKSIQAFQKTDIYKALQNISADLSLFERAQPLHVGSIKDTREAVLTSLNATYVQGKAVNLKSVASALSTKFEEIELTTGLKLRPKKLFTRKGSEMVIMDYAPLKAGLKPQDVPNGTEAVGKNPKTGKWEKWTPAHGKMFLKTTAEHEFLLIMNAAVDVGKDGMLMNMWGASKDNWFIDRMFHMNKTSISKLEYRMIRQIIKKFQNSSLRNMDPVSNDGYSKNGNANGFSVGIKEVTTIDVRGPLSTPEEKFMLRLFNKFRERFPIEDGQWVESPLLFSSKRQDLAHSFARNDLYLELDNMVNDGEISVEELREGAKLAQRFADDFYPSIDELTESDVTDDSKEDASEEYARQKQIEFDEVLYDLTVKYNEEIAKLENEFGDGIRSVFTTNMIFGINDKKKVRYLPPVELLSPKMVRDYFESWDDYFFNPSKTKGKLDTSQFPLDKLIKKAREC
jgi:polyhydroxyalkanoate synthesis regulator phasin